MNSVSRGIRFAAVLLAVGVCSPLAHSRDDLENQLRSDYQDKTLTLRHFYAGKHLNFRADGSLVNSAEIGPWTVDGLIFVKQIKQHDRTLQLSGRRVCVVFDSKVKPYRDVIASLEESQIENRNKLKEFFQKNDVEVEIELPSGKPDPEEISSAMNAVFLAPGESIGEIVPDYWRAYIDRIEGRPQSGMLSADTPYPAIGNGIKPPRATHMIDPNFTEEARRAKYHGMIVVSLVVDPSGSVKDVEITTPLGMGLDEKAVAAVKGWKFDPATKDGEPVAVKIAVEVDFHLY